MLAQLFPDFGQLHLALRIIGIELRNLVPTRQRFRLAAFRQKSLGGGFILRHGIANLALLLKQQRVARDALGRLDDSLQEASIDNQRLVGFAGVGQAVENQTVVFGRLLRFIEAGVQIAERLNGLLVGRIGAVYGFILRDRLA